MKGRFQQVIFFLVSFTVLAVTGLFATIYGPILVELSETFNVSLESMGFVFTLYSLGIIVGAIIHVGLTTIKMGQRPKLNISFVAMLFALIIMSSSSKYVIFALSVFVCSVCLCNLQMSYLVAVSNSSTKSESSLITFSTFFIAFGALIGSILGPLIITHGLSYKLAFAIIAVVVLIIFILSNTRGICNKMHDPQDITHNVIFTSFNMNMLSLFTGSRKIVVMALTVSVFLLFAIEQLVNYWLPSFLRISKGLSLGFAGNTLAFYWLCMSLGRFVFGILVRYFSILKLLILSCLLSLTVLFFIFVSKTTALSFFLFGLCGFFLATLYPFFIGIASQCLPNGKSLIVPIFVIFGFFGSLSTNQILISVIKKMGISYLVQFLIILGSILLGFCLLIYWLMRGKLTE